MTCNFKVCLLWINFFWWPYIHISLNSVQISFYTSSSAYYKTLKFWCESLTWSRRLFYWLRYVWMGNGSTPFTKWRQYWLLYPPSCQAYSQCRQWLVNKFAAPPSMTTLLLAWDNCATIFLTNDFPVPIPSLQARSDNRGNAPFPGGSGVACASHPGNKSNPWLYSGYHFKILTCHTLKTLSFNWSI